MILFYMIHIGIIFLIVIVIDLNTAVIDITPTLTITITITTKSIYYLFVKMQEVLLQTTNFIVLTIFILVIRMIN